MARRVNTKFVVILSSALVGVGMVFVGIKGYQHFQNRNPDVVRARGEKAEKAGDLKAAQGHYAGAASLLSSNHRPGADELYAKSADLCMRISKEAQNQSDAVLYYQMAQENYEHALTENPGNRAVNETLLEEDYQNARFQPSLTNWRKVEQVAGTMIKNQDSIKPRLYRAEARLTLLGLNRKSMTTDSFKGIEEDLTVAQKFEPHSGRKVSLAAQMMMEKAFYSATIRGLGAENVEKDPQFLEEIAVVRRMLTSRLAGRWDDKRTSAVWDWCQRVPRDGIDIEIASSLGQLLLQQAGANLAQLRGSPAADDRTSVVETFLAPAEMLLGAAHHIDPNRDQVSDQLYLIYMNTNRFDNAEALLRERLTRKQTDPQSYFSLATFMRSRDNLPEAIKQFKEVAAHPTLGSGREAIRNYVLQWQAAEAAAWANMDLAEREGAASTGKPYLKEASEHIDRLRGMHAPSGIVELLDGRMQLLNNDIPTAVRTLRSAESLLSSAEGVLQERYRMVELQFVRVNEKQRQLGAAIAILEKVQELDRSRGQPPDIRVAMQRIAYLLQLGEDEKVLLAVRSVLGNEKEVPGTFENEKFLAPAVAQQAKTYRAVALARLKGDASPLKNMTGTALNVAAILIESGDFDSAIDYVKTALAQSTANDASNMLAYQYGIQCYVKKENNQEALKLAGEALAKYPDNTYFQVAKAQLENPQDKDNFEAQKKIFSAIKDPVQRNIELSRLYRSEGTKSRDAAIRAKMGDLEIAALSEAQDALKNLTSADDRSSLWDVLDRLFGANLRAAAVTGDAKYYQAAQRVINELEKLNLDGTNAKIYQGRLMLAQTNGKNGIQLLQQAVQLRPDLAAAHLILAQGYLALASVNLSSGTSAGNSNLNSALDELRETIRLQPNNILAIQLAIEQLIRRNDSASLKEAQTLLERGLAQAPHNSSLIGYTEIFPDRVDSSIAKREQLLKQNPDDRDNRYRLAVLYVRKKDKELRPSSRLDAIALAVNLIAEDFEKHKTELSTADFLARLYVEYDKADYEVRREKIQKDPASVSSEEAFYAGLKTRNAIAFYDYFIGQDDPVIRFSALLMKAEFFHSLTLWRDAVLHLAKDLAIQSGDFRQEAKKLLGEARKIEPAKVDDAERRLADLHFELNEMVDAEKLYLQILAENKNPDSDKDSVKRRLVEAQLYSQKFDEAISRLADFLKTHPKDIQGLILRAYSNIQMGNLAQTPLADRPARFKAAVDDLTNVVSLSPDNKQLSKALYYRATAQLGLGDKPEAAEEDLKQSAKLDSTAINSRVLLAQIYVRSQRYEEASREYHDILKQSPERLDVRVEYTGLLRSLAQLQLSLKAGERAPGMESIAPPDFVRSLRSLDPLAKWKDEVKDAKTYYPNSVDWNFMYADVLAMEGNQAEAQRYYEALYQAAPGSAEVVDAYLGSLLRSKSAASYNKVIEIVSPIIKDNLEFLKKNPQFISLLIKRGNAYLGVQKSDEAMADLDQALAISLEAAKGKNFTSLIWILGNVSKSGQKDLENPLLRSDVLMQKLQARVAADRTDLIAKIALVQVQMLSNQFADALTVIETMNTPSNDQQLQFMVLRQSALVRSRIPAQYKAAEEDYKKIEAIAPNNSEILNNYAFLLADNLERPKEAVAKAEQALRVLSTRGDPVEVATNCANIYDTLGWAYCLNKDYTKAVDALRTSVKIQPQAAAYYHLAIAMQKQGDNVAALLNCGYAKDLAIAKQDDDVLAKITDLMTKLESKPKLQP